MTPAQKRILLALTVVIALTRFFAVAHSLFDWDEALFAHGVRDFDVTQHHPHPPGYPLFIAAAKLFHAVGVPEFRALQVVVLLGAMALFPALFFLARQIGFDFGTAACGAAIFAFLPNVWTYGGTGFSDVPATAVVFVACALLLRGRHDARAYIAGAALLGIAAGFRPPNLLLGAVPALIATVYRLRARHWRAVIAAILLGGAIAGGSYLVAALQSGGIDPYLVSVRAQSQWVREVDSFRNPHRAPLRHMAKIFFVWPVQQRQQMMGLTILASLGLLAAIARRRKPPLLTLAIFAPFAVMAWLNLDYEAAARYAIPYMATHALLAAEALGLLSMRRARVHAALGFVVAAVFIVWTWPALRLQRTQDAPPVAAIEWVRANVPKDALIYMHGGIGPQASLLIPDRRLVYWDKPEDISLLAGDAWVVDLRELPNARNFGWPRKNALWKIVRRRNFEAAVDRASGKLGFGSGWHGDEGSFRWMARESVSSLPALRGKGKLYLRLYVPIDSLAMHPTIEVHLNGQLLERFAGSQPTIEKSWTAASRADAVNELRITTSDVVNPAARGLSPDGRDLGLRVDALSWMPLQ